MGVELFFLLLPLAAYSGWRLGRRQLKQETSPHQFAENYYKGLNYLLNEEQDKALDIFINMVAVDSDTVETHLALGNLFRRRGEVDRAIRVHQNLIARPALSRDQKYQALFELAEDYLKAGLLDRAEKLYEDLVRERAEYIPSLRRLKTIYQQEKEWDKALTVVQRLGVASGERLSHIVAHYHCEKAESFQRAGNHSQALKWVKKALQADAGSVRAALLQGEIETQQGDHRRAVKSYRRLLQQDLAFFPLALEPMTESFLKLKQSDELLALLYQVLDRRYSDHVMLHTASVLRQVKGADAAFRFVESRLAVVPTIKALHYLLDNASEREGERLVSLLKEGLSALEGQEHGYHCSHCGYSAKSLFWYCPSCQSWDTVQAT